MWFIYSLIAGIIFAIMGLLSRHYMKQGKDAWIVSFYFSFSFVLFFWPILFFYDIPSFSWSIYGVLVVAGVFSLAGNTIYYESIKTIGASTQKTIMKLRLLWLSIVGFVFFSENLTLFTILGMISIILGSLLIVDFSKWKVSRRGVLLVILNTFTAAVVAISLKYLLVHVHMFIILFFTALVASIIFMLVIPRFFSRAKKILVDWKYLLAFAALGLASNVFMLQALSYDVLSGVFFVMDASLVIVLVGEHFFLKEKERMWWKILALILVVLGTYLLRGL